MEPIYFRGYKIVWAYLDKVWAIFAPDGTMIGWQYSLDDAKARVLSR